MCTVALQGSRRYGTEEAEPIDWIVPPREGVLGSPSLSEMFAYHATTMANTIRTSLIVFSRKVRSACLLPGKAAVCRLLEVQHPACQGWQHAADCCGSCTADTSTAGSPGGPGGMSEAAGDCLTGPRLAQGNMPALLSHYRPDLPIYMFTDNTAVMRRLAMYHSVTPLYIQFGADADETFDRCSPAKLH